MASNAPAGHRNTPNGKDDLQRQTEKSPVLLQRNGAFFDQKACGWKLLYHHNHLSGEGTPLFGHQFQTVIPKGQLRDFVAGWAKAAGTKETPCYNQRDRHVDLEPIRTALTRSAKL